MSRTQEFLGMKKNRLPRRASILHEAVACSRLSLPQRFWSVCCRNPLGKVSAGVKDEKSNTLEVYGVSATRIRKTTNLNQTSQKQNKTKTVHKNRCFSSHT